MSEIMCNECSGYGCVDDLFILCEKCNGFGVVTEENDKQKMLSAIEQDYKDVFWRFRMNGLSIKSINISNMIATLTAKRIMRAGGGLIAQETGALYAKALLKTEKDKSKAWVINEGYKAGLRMIKKINQVRLIKNNSDKITLFLA
jgi:hypothetical protein